MMTKKLASMAWLAAASALCLPSASGPAKAQQAPIVLGVSLPLSGSAAAWGQQARAALSIAEKEINAKGPINGSLIKILIRDDGGDVNQSVLIVRQMISNEKVAVILGPFLSGPARVTIPLAKLHSVPFIEPSAAVPGLLEQARPWAVRIALIGEDANLAPFSDWLKKRNIKRLVIGYENTNPATQDAGSRQFVKGAELAGIEVVNKNDPVTWTVTQTDFSAVVTKIKSYKDVDALAIAPGNEVPLLAKELQRQGVKIPIWTGNIFGDDASLITRAGDSVERWVGVSQNWSGAPDPKVREFVAKYRAQLKEEAGKDEPPNTYSFNFYYSAMATVEILRKTKLNGSTDIAILRKAIIDGWNDLKDYALMQGAITIGPDGEARRPLFILEVRNGKWEMQYLYKP
jgi:branched-chain amino acid transport system substrate-binding protein